MSSDALEPSGISPADGDAPELSDDDLDDTFDFTGADMFTQEIENVNASDWDVDNDLLWGDGGAADAIDIGDTAFDSDFPI
ncbi:hypothetical protein DC31_08045 [Microbacterium sp. CH12i]|uniref:hypothetical protein n=1 Tax=Microbacterium sp. CH12i TaxID=1479651 RepID=UPI0004612126|nr:hypothetical protein [Microbacterium sp. CH12i]KDA06662.1 hypothetical protein DC31_08045 [Microbacterium sp. CH12i]